MKYSPAANQKKRVMCSQNTRGKLDFFLHSPILVDKTYSFRPFCIHCKSINEYIYVAAVAAAAFHRIFSWNKRHSTLHKQNKSNSSDSKEEKKPFTKDNDYLLVVNYLLMKLIMMVYISSMPFGCSFQLLLSVLLRFFLFCFVFFLIAVVIRWLILVVALSYIVRGRINRSVFSSSKFCVHFDYNSHFNVLSVSV